MVSAVVPLPISGAKNVRAVQQCGVVGGRSLAQNKLRPVIVERDVVRPQRKFDVKWRVRGEKRRR